MGGSQPIEAVERDTPSHRLSLDPRDPAFYQDPYPTYERLHRESPVFYWEELQRWCFVRHRDVSAILRDRRFGRSMAHLEGVEAREPVLVVDRFSMLDMEPPSHTRLRRLVQGAFIARQIERMRSINRWLNDSMRDRNALPEGDPATMSNAEQQRLEQDRCGTVPWKRWGP